MPHSPLNIAQCIDQHAQNFPWKQALVFPHGRDRQGRVAYTHLTFAELKALIDRYAWGLTSIGITRGMRVLLMVRPSLEFPALVFALFRVGAVPVLIDPGMGWRQFMHCVAAVAPQAFLGIPKAHLLRLVCRRPFRSIQIPVTLGRKWGWGGWEIDRLPARDEPFPIATTDPEDMAAILFTTGSTGPAKGVVYTHRIFDTQVRFLRTEYHLGPDDVDLPCFPLFGLFSTALGATAVIPDMDPTHPADVNPRHIIEAINDHGVTYSFGSPALWRTVSAYCAEKGVTLPSLRRIFMAGAPVPAYLHDRLLNQVLGSGAETYTPYGATEALPVASFTGSEMLAKTAERSAAGDGICVGRPVAEAIVRIIRITDEPIHEWNTDLLLPQGEIGEITVKGPMVTPAYFNRPDQTELAKIHDHDGIWHRMGDLGYLDDNGRIWVCGRKSHRVITADTVLFTIQCEAVFNAHPHVYRSALVGGGDERHHQQPVIIVEPEPGRFPRTPGERDLLTSELLHLGRQNSRTQTIQHVLFHHGFPVDIRHNAKIRREELALWARRQRARHTDGQ